MPSGESMNVLEIMAWVFPEISAAITSRCQLAMGQEGRALRTAHFRCSSPTKHDFAEIHFTPPPCTRQQAGNLAWVKHFLLERGWWDLAASGLAFLLCAKKSSGGRAGLSKCPP